MSQKIAIIIGAGPAGLTAAYEFLTRTDIKPIVLERSQAMGGIAQTVNYKGNRIDIGGHRFFSKSDRVMDWWLKILPLEERAARDVRISYHQQSREVSTSGQGVDPETTDRVMLVRQRTSRIYYLRQFFAYPISLSLETLRQLGPWRTVRIVASYLKSVLWPIPAPQNLEEFFINRFGRELYLTFFKSYTEKVWGTSCQQISAEWGAQRIKGLSISKAVLHFLTSLVPKPADVAQKGTETSLIEQFFYPKLGPGLMWEEVARQVLAKGGEIKTGYQVVRLHTDGWQVTAVEAVREGGETAVLRGDLFFSTMAIKDLVTGLNGVPQAIREISQGLVYRDFITVGLLVDRLKIQDPQGGLVRDNWIYIQEPEVFVGRLQIFNNWSPYMVADPQRVWIGLEYFCNEGDDLWQKSDADLLALGGAELEQIGILDRQAIRDGVVIRMPKTYPAYFGTYNRFPELRNFLDQFTNLFLLGRNGMHKYNNQDHSMLTAMTAVDNLLAGRSDKSNLWAVNTEEEYHEERA